MINHKFLELSMFIENEIHSTDLMKRTGLNISNDTHIAVLTTVLTKLYIALHYQPQCDGAPYAINEKLLRDCLTISK